MFLARPAPLFNFRTPCGARVKKFAHSCSGPLTRNPNEDLAHVQLLVCLTWGGRKNLSMDDIHPNSFKHNESFRVWYWFITNTR